VLGAVRHAYLVLQGQHTSAYVSVRQHTHVLAAPVRQSPCGRGLGDRLAHRLRPAIMRCLSRALVEP
jgi:hypothetical protein